MMAKMVPLNKETYCAVLSNNLSQKMIYSHKTMLAIAPNSRSECIVITSSIASYRLKITKKFRKNEMASIMFCGWLA